MSKERKRAIKLAERFRKSAEKEADRVRALKEKCNRLEMHGDDGALFGQLIERLNQKDLQANGDLIWADGFVEQLRSAVAKQSKTGAGEQKKSTNKSKRNPTGPNPGLKVIEKGERSRAAAGKS